MATLASKSFLLSQKPRSSELFIPEWDATVRLEAFNVERRVAFMSVLQENAQAIKDHKSDPKKFPAVEPLDAGLRVDSGERMFGSVTLRLVPAERDRLLTVL